MLIYSLSSSENPEIVRYIGYTKKPLKRRLIEHLCDSKSMRTRRDKWIQYHLKRGHQIIPEIIDECDSIQDMKMKEIKYISLFKSFGARLVNGTSGGDGVVGMVHTKEMRDLNAKRKAKRVYCFNYLTKKLVATYPSVKQMCSEMGLQRSQVGYVLARRGNHSKGYTFSYTGECPREIPLVLRAWNKGLKTKGMQRFRASPVTICKGEETIDFETISSACDFLGIKNHAVLIVALRKNKYKDWDIYYTNKKIC